MRFSNLLKQLKRSLRRKRRWLSLGTWILLIGVAMIAGFYQFNRDEPTRTSGIEAIEDSYGTAIYSGARMHEVISSENFISLMQADDHSWEVVVRKQYVCGETAQQLGRMASADILLLYDNHPQWEINMSEGEVTFIEQIADLSPECKEHGYMGVDVDGNLSMFEGPPEAEKVIETFFQLNIQYLESHLPQQIIRQLHEGIRITDLAEYNSVISTFSDFAIPEMEKAMKQIP